ncbi:MAG: hypothetical protein H8E66_24770 [Planctomycetes bacterium]|nr:hypothetical protein [Planctomycetota bacterium]
MIVVDIAVVGGTMMMICGGVIFGVVMSVRQARQDFELGMDDVQWDVSQAQPNVNESMEFVATGRYSDAIVSIDEGLQLEPDNAFLHNGKAWILATCPDDAVRDGELAVEHATKACDLTNWSSFAYVDTIAAAYAESGDFESAVDWQEEAIRLAGELVSDDFYERLELFQADKSYREGVSPYKEIIEQPATEEEPMAAESSDTPEEGSAENDDDEKTTTNEEPNS